MPIIIIDGIPVEMIEYEGTPPPQKRVRVKNPGTKPTMKTRKLGNRDYTTPASRDRESQPGKYDYDRLRNSQINALFNYPRLPLE